MKEIINKYIILFLLIFINFKSVYTKENPNQFQVEADKSIEYFEKQKFILPLEMPKLSKETFQSMLKKLLHL